MDIKDAMIWREEHGLDGSYEATVEDMLGAADDYRTRLKEQGWRNPLVAPMFCVHCHWSENAHPREDCPGFTPGDPEEVRAHNRALGLPAG